MSVSKGEGLADKTEQLEQADKEFAQQASRHREDPAVEALGTFSEIADQIPLSLVCGSVILGGMLSNRLELTQTGLRMMTAHVLANSVKRLIKNRVRRTRPHVMIEEQTYRFEPGNSQGGHESSFPSGHTAGAVSVAVIVAHDAPTLATPAYLAAALIGGIQVPRAKHYLSDVAAGAALGLLAGKATLALWSKVEDQLEPTRSRKERWVQPVSATARSNVAAGVSKPSVFRGRVLSRKATWSRSC